MKIEFSAYADDYTVRGAIGLEGERLTDFLDAAHDIDVTDLTVRALDDGREIELPFAQIRREELCAVVATGPRGRADRRIRTRAYPMRVQVGPYSVVGYLQVLPTADPWTIVQRRQIIALSPARVAFDIAGARTEESHAAVLVIGGKIEALRDATDEEVGLSRALDFPLTADARAKDLTTAGIGRGGGI